MKVLKIIAIAGNLAMLLGCIFLIINLALDAGIFPGFVTIPLMILGIIGNVAALINSTKRR